MGIDYFYKAVLLAGGISMLIFFHSFQAEAQVVIEEKMEIEPQATEISGRDSMHTTATTGSDAFPFWLPVEQNRFMMLKSGALELHFEDAKLRQKMAQSDKVTLTVIRDGKEVRSKTITPLDRLPDPMNVNQAGCYDDRFVYNTDTMRVAIGTHRGNGGDAFVAKGTEYPAVFADRNFGDLHNLDVTDVGFIIDPDTTNPDSTFEYKASSFLNFDLRNLRSQVDLHSAILSLTVTNFATGPVFLQIATVDDSWSEETITWNNQPSAGFFDDFTGSLNGNSFHFDITSLIDLSQSEIGFKLEPPNDSTGYGFWSKEAPFGPALLLDISNPAPPAADPTVKIDSLKAGDIVKWEFKDFDINDQYRNLVFGEDYYELEFQGPSGSSCTVERLNITAQIEDAYPGPPQIVMNLETSPDTVAPGDTAQITPQMHFVPDSVTAAFPPGQFFLAAIAEGPDFGTLWNGFGSTADFYPRTRSPFYFIAADSIATDPSVAVVASSAKLRLQDDVVITAAPDQEAEKSKQSSVTGELPDPIEVRGKKQVVVREDSVRLTVALPDSGHVWPTLRDRDGGGNDATRSNMEQNIVVSLLRSGQAVTEQSVLLTAFRLEGSGGHDHELSDGSPEREQLGRFIFEGNTTEVELEAETNAEGQIEFDYRSSVFSGQYVVKAATFIDGDSLFAKDTLTVSVPDLEFLGEDTTYVLSGGTCNHHGPERPGNPIPARCESPDQIHYIAETAKDSLVAAAKDYLNSDINTEDEKVRINDISLPLGGYFDINGNWEGDHVSHRIGEDIDVETVLHNKELQETFINNGWIYIHEPGRFPHFRFDE